MDRKQEAWVQLPHPYQSLELEMVNIWDHVDFSCFTEEPLGVNGTQKVIL